MNPFEVATIQSELAQRVKELGPDPVISVHESNQPTSEVLPPATEKQSVQDEEYYKRYLPGGYLKPEFRTDPDPDLITVHTHAHYLQELERDQENPLSLHGPERSVRPLRNIVAEKLTHAANVLVSATNNQMGRSAVRWFAFDKTAAPRKYAGITIHKKHVSKHRLEKV